MHYCKNSIECKKTESSNANEYYDLPFLALTWGPVPAVGYLLLTLRSKMPNNQPLSYPLRILIVSSLLNNNFTIKEKE